MLKYEEEDQDQLRDEKEARLSKEARHKEEEHKSAWLNIEEGVCLTLEVIRREE